MSDASKLQQGINRVRDFRSHVRSGSAWAAFVSVLIIAFLVAMALDVATDMSKLERAVTLAIIVAVGVWAFRKFVQPILGVKESDVHIASLIERQHGLKSDLVGALQFTDHERQQFGSNELREAAVDHANKISSRLNYLQGFSKDQLTNRTIGLIACCIVVIAIIADFPGYGKAFINRIFLGNAHYPTETRIVAINEPGDYAPFGMPLVFDVDVNGVLPESGMIKLNTHVTGLRTTIELLPDPENPRRYTGQLDRAAEDFSYQVFLGDAYTHPKQVTLTPLPVIDVAFEIETPEYAAEKFAAVQAESRGPVAISGSRVIPVITADKPLASATFNVGEEALDLSADGEAFKLQGSAHPLQHVTETIRWTAQVVDHQGLSLEHPMTGVVQVRPDLPPSIGIATASRLIWSGAAPTVQYKAVDDYGIASVTAFISHQRWQDGASEEPVEREVEVVKPADYADAVEGDFVVDLASIDLAKGDRLFISFAVTDHRGYLGGETVRSEPIILEVSDREGVLESLRDLDAEIERKLDQIINAQLGIGDGP